MSLLKVPLKSLQKCGAFFLYFLDKKPATYKVRVSNWVFTSDCFYPQLSRTQNVRAVG